MRKDFSGPLIPTNERNSLFSGNYFVDYFGDGKLYPTVLEKMVIQTVVPSQVSAIVILRIQAKISSMTKNWDLKTTKDRLHVCPKHFQD